MVWDPESIRSLNTDLGRYFDCFNCVSWGKKGENTSDGIVFSKKGMASKSIQLTATTGGFSSRFPMTDLSSSTLANLGADELGWISLILTLIFRLAVSSSGKQYNRHKFFECKNIIARQISKYESVSHKSSAIISRFLEHKMWHEGCDVVNGQWVCKGSANSSWSRITSKIPRIQKAWFFNSNLALDLNHYSTSQLDPLKAKAPFLIWL